jgi:hypothetical protein
MHIDPPQDTTSLYHVTVDKNKLLAGNLTVAHTSEFGRKGFHVFDNIEDAQVYMDQIKRKGHGNAEIIKTNIPLEDLVPDNEQMGRAYYAREFKPEYIQFKNKTDGFARGGIIPGAPSKRDNIMIMARTGEEIVTPEDPRHIKNMRSFQKGGVVNQRYQDELRRRREIHLQLMQDRRDAFAASSRNVAPQRGGPFIFAGSRGASRQGVFPDLSLGPPTSAAPFVSQFDAERKRIQDLTGGPISEGFRFKTIPSDPRFNKNLFGREVRINRSGLQTITDTGTGDVSQRFVPSALGSVPPPPVGHGGDIRQDIIDRGRREREKFNNFTRLRDELQQAERDRARASKVIKPGAKFTEAGSANFEKAVDKFNKDFEDRNRELARTLQEAIDQLKGTIFEHVVKIPETISVEVGGNLNIPDFAKVVANLALIEGILKKFMDALPPNHAARRALEAAYNQMKSLRQSGTQTPETTGVPDKI